MSNNCFQSQLTEIFSQVMNKHWQCGLISIFFLCLCLVQSNAQIVTVIDQETEKPIYQATIVSDDEDKGAITDGSGQATWAISKRQLNLLSGIRPTAHKHSLFQN